jgi:hypothetical protein
LRWPSGIRDIERGVDPHVYELGTDCAENEVENPERDEGDGFHGVKN